MWRLLWLTVLLPTACRTPPSAPASGDESAGATPTVAINRAGDAAPINPPPAASVSPIRPEQLRPLNPVRHAFARYVADVHRHLHPRYAARYLARRPPQSGDAVVLVELVLSGSNGRLAASRVHTPSGDDSFDRGALDVVRQAEPFPVAPPSVWSFDGNVYLRWALHRDPDVACTTRGAAPFLLRAP
jgi:TonB family protein